MKIETKNIKMALPKMIEPCPILDALFEIRFSSKIHPSAVFGLIYNALQSGFPKVENLPILQLPEQVRASDPNFRFKPHYKISNDKYVVQIGPDVLTVSSFPAYAGWESFSNQIFSILDKLEGISIVNSVERIGIRYINFFDSNIFSNVDLQISIGGETIPYKNTIVRTEVEHDKYSSSLQIANNANHGARIGSIIDIDTFISKDLGDFFEQKESIVNEGHRIEKNLFFSLLKDDFLEKLNPIY